MQDTRTNDKPSEGELLNSSRESVNELKNTSVKARHLALLLPQKIPTSNVLRRGKCGEEESHFVCKCPGDSARPSLDYVKK